MPIVVAIRFKDSGKIYYFDPCELALLPNEHVVVETARGLEWARVVYAPHEVAESEIVGELKPVLRRAEPTDLERLRVLQTRHSEVLARCAEKVIEHGLPMHLVKAEYSFDGSRLTFYFTAEKRVDFRLLVRDLARTFKSRIELRQIGPRDEAKLLGGLGPCGRVLCCASFLPDYARVSIKMAKDQDLPLNPTKISGICGRLLCCLSYEHEQYVALRAALPRKGAWVQTPDGSGEVVDQHVLTQQVLVQLASSGMQETYDLTQVELATAQEVATARSHQAEGLPSTVSPRRTAPPERERGERRKLRDEIDQYRSAEDLDLLEASDDSKTSAAATPPVSRQSRWPAPTQEAAPPRVERGPKLPRGTPPPSAPAPIAPTARTAPPDAVQGEPPVTPSSPPVKRRRRRGGHGSTP